MSYRMWSSAMMPAAPFISRIRTAHISPTFQEISRRKGEKANRNGNEVQASVARRLRAPPYAARRKGLRFRLPELHYAASATGARLSLATVHFAPITVVAHRDKDQLVHSLSILFHPHRPPTKGSLVEVSASQPSPVQLVKLPFMSIAPEGAEER